MPLSKKFRETIRDRAQSSKALRDGMLLDVINTLLEGDTELTKIALRNYINATIGFEPLAEAMNTNSKSLHRMLGQSGNPSFEKLLLMLKTLQDHAGINIQAKKTKAA